MFKVIYGLFIGVIVFTLCLGAHEYISEGRGLHPVVCILASYILGAVTVAVAKLPD